MNNELIYSILEKISDSSSIENNISLSKRTWIHRGGNVSYWITPASTHELETIASLLYSHHVSFITIGHTSNLWFKNDFDVDCIIDTKKLKGIYEIDNNLIVCDCALPMKQLSKYCIEHGYAGYEGMINLPGTAAGAIVNNSGCYKCGVQSTLDSIDIITEDGKLKHLPASELGYSFRTSKLKDGSLKGVIVRAYFDTSKHEAPFVLQSRAEECHQDRQLKQDSPAHNLGSTVNVSHIRRTPLGIFAFLLSKISNLFVDKAERINKLRNRLICIICGKPKVAHYISNKRITCFIWKDANADRYFDDYLIIVRRLYQRVEVEIEIKEAKLLGRNGYL